MVTKGIACIWGPVLSPTTLGDPSSRKRGKMEMRSIFSWVALVVAGIALLIAAIGAILALLAGHARFIEVAWVSIAASLFILAWASLEQRE